MQLRTFLRREGVPSSPPLRVFVYGTLKRGGWGYTQYGHGHIRQEAAAVVGRVVDRPEGYPALFVPPESVVAWASDDLLADAALSGAFAPVPLPHRMQDLPVPAPPWRWVRGEMLEYPDGGRLTFLDDFEEFTPGEPSLYCRVLAPVLVNGSVTAAWMYCSPHNDRFARVQPMQPRST